MKYDSKVVDRLSAGNRPVVTARSDAGKTQAEKKGEESVEGRKRSRVAPLGNAFKTDQTRLKRP